MKCVNTNMITSEKHVQKAPPKLETCFNLEAKKNFELNNLDDHIKCVVRTADLLHLKSINQTFDKTHRAD